MMAQKWLLTCTCLVVFALIHGVNVQFHQIKDDKLCNNGNVPRYSSAKCFEPAGGREYVCDERTIAPEDCREAVLEMVEFTSGNLLAEFPSVDGDFSVRRIVVKLRESQNPDDVGREIDKFLVDKLWWYVVKEPFHWNKHTHHIIVIDRANHELEYELRKLSALQFPLTMEECAKSALQLNHHDFYHPGWYSMLAVYSIVHSEIPFAITAMYVSMENGLNDNTAFITGSECPSTVNKWECAFLATTNCPIPAVVTSCTGTNCVHNTVPDTRWSSAIFDRASRDGRIMQAGTPAFQALQKKCSSAPEFNERFVKEAKAVSTHKGHAGRVRYLLPFQPQLAPFQSMMSMELELYTYSLLLRPSAYYRSRIAEAIKGFHAANNMTSADRCVAAQIRRGDRAMPGTNITEFCLKPENKDSDMGCATVPFASVTLEHVVASAAKLVEPSVRTLIVTTDDEEWLDQQRQDLRASHPEWRVLNLKAPTHSTGAAPAKGSGESYDYMRFGAGTASGVLLHGSIELSRQCEAFVGHFGCGGTMLVYKSMCARHNHREYVCPPSFDVRTIPELIIPHNKR